MTHLTFRTIDLSKHSEGCVRFRRDSFACSFADGLQRFDAEYGPNGRKYVHWLSERIQEFPQGCVHAWSDDRVVGQIDSRPRNDGTGKVNLFYLSPEVRDQGLGRQLNDYVVGVFRDAGIAHLQLSSSTENARAMRLYQACGWKDLGPRPGYPEVHNFELII